MLIYLQVTQKESNTTNKHRHKTVRKPERQLIVTNLNAPTTPEQRPLYAKKVTSDNFLARPSVLSFAFKASTHSCWLWIWISQSFTVVAVKSEACKIKNKIKNLSISFVLPKKKTIFISFLPPNSPIYFQTILKFKTQTKKIHPNETRSGFLFTRAKGYTTTHKVSV